MTRESGPERGGPSQPANRKPSSDNGSAPDPLRPPWVPVPRPTQSGDAWPAQSSRPGWWEVVTPSPAPLLSRPRTAWGGARHRTRGHRQPPPRCALAFARGFSAEAAGGASGPSGGGVCVYFRRRPAQPRQRRPGPDTVSDLRPRCVRPQLLRAAARPPRPRVSGPIPRGSGRRDGGDQWGRTEPRSLAAPLLGKLRPPG